MTQTKAQEFEALAVEAMSAPWRVARTPGADDGYSGLTIEALYDCIAYNVATPKTADFIAWCGTNRDLIARALRRDEAIESPTYEVAVAIGQAVESPCFHPGWDDRGFAALAAFRESVQ